MSVLAAGVLHICQREGEPGELVAAVEAVLRTLRGSDIETAVTEHADQIYVHYRVHDSDTTPELDKKISQHFRARQTILALFREDSKRIARQMERGMSMHDRKIS